MIENKNDKQLNSSIDSPINERGNSQLGYKKSSATQRFFFFILSALIAFGIWIYASSLQSTTQEVSFNQIPITVNIPAGFSIINSNTLTVDIRVSGSSRELNNLTSSNFSAYADGMSITENGKYTLDIEIKMPDNITLESQSTYTVVVDVDKMATTTMDIDISLSKSDIADPFSLEQMTSDITQVSISGPAKTLEKIQKASVDIEVGHLEESKTFSGEIMLYDENGNSIDKSSLSLSSESVSVFVQIFTQKTVPLKVSFVNDYFSNLNAKVSVSPETVTIKGEKSVLDNISEIQIANVDERQIVGSSIEKEILLPEKVYLLDKITTANISVSFEGCLNASYKTNSSKIVVNNPNNLKYNIITTDIAITIRTTNEIAKNIQNKNIVVKLDLSGYSSGAGTVSAPITISYPSDIEGYAYEIGNYTVQVTIG